MSSAILLVLLLINTIFFFVLLIKNVVADKVAKYSNIQSAEVAILGIALTQYALTFIIENSNILTKDTEIFAQQLRYFDWLLTTPLLLYTYWKLAELEGYSGDFFILFIMDFVMIVSGIIAENFVKNRLYKYYIFIIGSLAYLVIFIKILEIMSFFSDKNQYGKKQLGYFFLIGWLIYPLGFFFNEEFKFVLYSIGDFINKGIYSIVLNNILQEN